MHEQFLIWLVLLHAGNRLGFRRRRDTKRIRVSAGRVLVPEPGPPDEEYMRSLKFQNAPVMTDMTIRITEADMHPLSSYIAWAGLRNREPILEVFKELFPKSGNVLELASGSGMHINHFASHFKKLRFQPSDFDETVFAAIKTKRAGQGNLNVEDPININLLEPETWPSPATRLYDVIFAVNLLQVAPIAIACGIAQISSKLLKESGFLAIYGPFKLGGKYTTRSNEAFDREILGAKIPDWGLKDVRDLERAANEHGIFIKRLLELPANNIMLVFRKA